MIDSIALTVIKKIKLARVILCYVLSKKQLPSKNEKENEIKKKNYTILCRQKSD